MRIRDLPALSFEISQGHPSSGINYFKVLVEPAHLVDEPFFKGGPDPEQDLGLSQPGHLLRAGFIRGRRLPRTHKDLNVHMRPADPLHEFGLGQNAHKCTDLLFFGSNQAGHRQHKHNRD